MRGRLALLAATLVLLAGCRTGTAQQELEQLRTRASTLEAENAHLRGQVSLTEQERDQLRQQNNSLATDLAKAQATAAVGGTAEVVAGEHLVVLPREVHAGEWVAVYVKNYPVRLLPLAGVALRGATGANLSHVKQLAGANLFLLSIPQTVPPGDYSIVLGEAGPMGPGAKLDDQVAIAVKPR